MPERSHAAWLERQWYSARAPWLLRPLSMMYGVAMRLRSAAYRAGWLQSAHPGVPVVVIGNLTVGGTGKTPFTLWLAESLRVRGIEVGIASRGYGGSARGPQLVRSNSDAAEVGDEALMMSRRSGVSVCIARRRVDAARMLAQQGCQIVIADDGLQHLALQRDLEIVVVDAARGFGNAMLLPAGPMRESSARLASVDLIVVNGATVPAAVAGLPAVRMSLRGETLVSLQNGEQRPATAFHAGQVHAVAGIGHPERFFGHLRTLGISAIEHPFPDHHRLTAQEVAFGDQRPVVMTEKDAVKCTFADARLWFLPVTATLDAADAERVLGSVLPLVNRGVNS